MRIDELLRREHHKLVGTEWKTPATVSDWLKSNGFGLIGSGYFSDVYSKPTSDKIVKVLMGSELEPVKCALAFARFQRKTRNKHFPKVFAIKNINPQRSESTSSFVIIMEKIPLNLDISKIQWKKDREYNFGLATFLVSYMGNMIWMDFSSLAPKIFPPDMHMPTDFSEKHDYVNEWIETYARKDSLANAIKIAIDLVNRYDCGFADFKYDNTRMRKDGTIVLLDVLPF